MEEGPPIFVVSEEGPTSIGVEPPADSSGEEPPILVVIGRGAPLYWWSVNKALLTWTANRKVSLLLMVSGARENLHC